jgi:hypothetical protein
MALKFFCENCKYEVPLEGDRCPFCGKTFYSVYCPRCKKEGFAYEFKNGCPQCGYLKESFKSSRRNTVFRRAGSKASLPRWLYSGTIILLGMTIIGLIIFIILKGNIR